MLKPRFQLSADYSAGPHALPTSHTCFNMLCLPVYRTQKDLHDALKTAVEEGCEGFELR